MKNLLVCIFFYLIINIFLCFAFVSYPGAGEKGVIKKGDRFPDTYFSSPDAPPLRSYLGIGDAESFTLSDVNAGFLFLVVISVDCKSCQTQTPMYNRLYELIISDPFTKDRLKIFAVAVGNDAKEVKAYADKNEVPYPIVPDPDYTIYRSIGNCSTPLTIFIMNNTNGKGKALVLDTVTGTNFWYKEMFEETKKLFKDHGLE